MVNSSRTTGCPPERSSNSSWETCGENSWNYGAGGQYFITSERFVSHIGDNGPRRYTIRKAFLDGRIETPDLPDGSNGFQAYETANAARKAAEKLSPAA